MHMQKILHLLTIIKEFEMDYFVQLDLMQSKAMKLGGLFICRAVESLQ